MTTKTEKTIDEQQDDFVYLMLYLVDDPNVKNVLIVGDMAEEFEDVQEKMWSKAYEMDFRGIGSDGGNIVKVEDTNFWFVSVDVDNTDFEYTNFEDYDRIAIEPSMEQLYKNIVRLYRHQNAMHAQSYMQSLRKDQ